MNAIVIIDIDIKNKQKALKYIWQYAVPKGKNLPWPT